VKFSVAQNFIFMASFDNSRWYVFYVLFNLIKIGYLPLLHTNYLDDQTKSWCPAGLLNIDAYSSGVKESNSKPMTYSRDAN